MNSCFHYTLLLLPKKKKKKKKSKYNRDNKKNAYFELPNLFKDSSGGTLYAYTFTQEMPIEETFV